MGLADSGVISDLTAVTADGAGSVEGSTQSLLVGSKSKYRHRFIASNRIIPIKVLPGLILTGSSDSSERETVKRLKVREAVVERGKEDGKRAT